MTVRELDKYLKDRLTAILGQGEGRATARLIMDDVARYTPAKVLMYGDRELEPETVRRIEAMLPRIARGEPVQYIVGSARFMGRNFAVTPATLIPRPETEGLVDMIIADAGARVDLRVLDIGTGSGCIAISLAAALRFASVTAIDISPAALDIARKNAIENGVRVDFIHADALHLDVPDEPQFDIIVSNPPYIADDEKIATNVFDYEPHSALFVPASDPLIFYRAIARYARKALVPGGRLYFEINPRFVGELKSMLADTGLDDINVIRDYIGNYRFATATNPK